VILVAVSETTQLAVDTEFTSSDCSGLFSFTTAYDTAYTLSLTSPSNIHGKFNHCLLLLLDFLASNKICSILHFQREMISSSFASVPTIRIYDERGVAVPTTQLSASRISFSSAASELFILQIGSLSQECAAPLHLRLAQRRGSHRYIHCDVFAINFLNLFNPFSSLSLFFV
jgi:hypothetical protein